jgi:hypothetical protein
LKCRSCRTPRYSPRVHMIKLTQQRIEACGGDARDAVKALIVANEFFGIGSLRIDTEPKTVSPVHIL